MPFRAFDDSDIKSLICAINIVEACVSMPFRAFDDSDGNQRWINNLALNIIVSMPFRAFDDSDLIDPQKVKHARKLMSQCPSGHSMILTALVGAVVDPVTWGNVSMPFRAFDDSDAVRLHLSPLIEKIVSMPFRAFDDSDPADIPNSNNILILSLNALPGIR